MLLFGVGGFFFIHIFLIPHEFLQLDVEVALGLVGHYLLHHSRPPCSVAGAFVLKDTDKLDSAVKGGEIIGEMERIHVVEYDGVDGGGEEDGEDEDGEVLHHLGHLLGFQLAVHLAFRILLDSLTKSAVDTAVEPPCRVAIQ